MRMNTETAKKVLSLLIYAREDPDIKALAMQLSAELYDGALVSVPYKVKAHGTRIYHPLRFEGPQKVCKHVVY